MILDSLDTSWIQEEDKIDSIQNHYVREPMDFIHTHYIYINSDSAIEKIVCEKEPLTQLTNGKMGIHKERLLQMVQTKKTRTSTASSVYKYIDSRISSVDAGISSVDAGTSSVDAGISSSFCCNPVVNLNNDKKSKYPFLKNNSKFSSRKYKIQDILSFVLDVEPENIQSISELDIEKGIIQGTNDNVSKISSSFLKSISLFDEIVIPDSIFIFHNINCLYFIFKTSDIIKSILKYSGDTRSNRYSDKAGCGGVTKKVRILLPNNFSQEDTKDKILYHTNKSLKNLPSLIERSNHTNKYTRKNENL